MSFNYGKEERKWRLWKEAEEKQMRELGVDENTIEKLRVHDWAVFNSNRRYYRRLQDAGTYLEEVVEDSIQTEIKTVDEFLDSIESERLYKILITVDRLTLQAVILQAQGFSIREISAMLELKEDTVYKRLNRLREKIKKIL
ncbi:MAG: sigma-70 family RNA polymerase sigma factor [Christensenellales bacterium]|nr:sigma-70 family RNA polymerase sigma factor [Christensenellales bacterium]